MTIICINEHWTIIINAVVARFCIWVILVDLIWMNSEFDFSWTNQSRQNGPVSVQQWHGFHHDRFSGENLWNKIQFSENQSIIFCSSSFVSVNLARQSSGAIAANLSSGTDAQIQQRKMWTNDENLDRCLARSIWIRIIGSRDDGIESQWCDIVSSEKI